MRIIALRCGEWRETREKYESRERKSFRGFRVLSGVSRAEIDAGLFHFPGSNAQQIANGFTQREPKKKEQQPKCLPFHEDDLRNLLNVITPTQSQPVFIQCLGEFFRAKYVRERRASNSKMMKRWRTRGAW